MSISLLPWPKQEQEEGQAYSSSSAKPPGLYLEGDGKQWKTNEPFNLSISLLPWPKQEQEEGQGTAGGRTG
ncbi:MAG: hypothetical protein ACKPFH_16505, partial [Dolichospermum sp.]